MRINLLDNLRGFSIAIVLIYHFFGEGFLAYGNLGVLIFFIISGYCIALSIDHSHGPFHFYSKRIGRLFPALVVCGFITAAVKIIFPYLLLERPVGWLDPLLTPLDLATQGLFRLHPNYPDGSYWSLISEFEFYALIAVLMIKYRKNELLKALGLATVILPILPEIIKVTGFISWRHPPQMTYFLPFFLAGFSLKHLIENFKNQVALKSLFLSFVVYILFIIFDFKTNSLPSSIPGLIVLSLTVLLILFESISSLKLLKFSDSLSFLMRPFSFLGVISYPLYLLHQDIGNTILFIFHADCVTHECVRNTIYYRLFLVPISMICLAWLVYFFIEKPTIKPFSAFVYNLGSKYKLNNLTG